MSQNTKPRKQNYWKNSNATLMSEENKPLSFVEKMKLKAKNQQVYGGKSVDKSASLTIKDCPNCGAARAQQDGITHCAYCGFEFIAVKISDGINLKKEDNSHNK